MVKRAINDILYFLNTVASIPYFSIAFQEANGAAARLVEGILRRKSFYFQQRTGKLDMRAIGRVDVDKVIKDVDIDTLQVSVIFVLCDTFRGTLSMPGKI